MDYRLVKQFWNNAVDSFFNFFYKMSDFFVVFLDLGWAFFDIWYQFFAIFGNIFLYFYYLLLFILDKLSMSRAPIFFWRRTYSRKTAMPKKAYNKKSSGTIVPPNFRTSGYSSGSSSKTASVSASPSSSTAFKPKSSSPRPSSFGGGRSKRRESRVLLLFKKIGSFFAGFFSSIASGLGRFVNVFLDKLKPVKDDVPAGRKSLIDDYMKEYERKKNHR